jgi:hypothetical protein
MEPPPVGHTGKKTTPRLFPISVAAAVDRVDAKLLQG